MLSPDDVRVLDLNSAWHGVRTSVLMQNAGRAVFEEARRVGPKRALVVCGLGNNGGDGAVAAKLLSQAGIAVNVLYAGDPATIKSAEARLAHETLDTRGIRVETFRSAERAKAIAQDADLIIDALLGVGVDGDLREPTKTLVRVMNASRRPILSVDIPTGMGGRLQTRARSTVTFHARKERMQNAGRVRVADIGIPEAAETEVGPGDLVVHYPRPSADSHKGQNGRLLAVLGGPYTGAPILASMGALRTGCDIVRLYAPEDAAEAAQAYAPDLIVHEGKEDQRLVPDDVEAIEPLMDRVDALLIGSGTGTDRATQRAIEEILRASQRKRLALVLDADALAVAGRNKKLLSGRPVLCTPHTQEYRKLAGERAPDADDAERVARASRTLGAAILLKAPTAIMSDGKRTRLGRVHPPGFTPGGVGDVLAGSCAALIAKGLDPFRAATAASFLVGAASRNAVQQHSHGARASDVAAGLGHVLREWLPA